MSKIHRDRSRMVVARSLRGVGNEELLCNRYRVSLCETKRVLWMDSGDDSIIM